MGHLTLILGGARSGKSAYAERLANERGGNVLYIATAEALDDEMATRINKHQADRSKRWKTLEIPLNVGKLLTEKQVQAQVILLDCITLLISNVMMTLPDYEAMPDEQKASGLVKSEIIELLSTIRASSAQWIIVSNEVGMGLVPPYPLGRMFRDQLGWANQQIAATADEVIFMIAGFPWKLTNLP